MPARRRLTAAALLVAVGALGLASASATSATASDASAAAPTATTATAAAPASGTVVAQIIADTNAVRASAGLAPLRHNAQLDTVASNWSWYQAGYNTMSHNPNLATSIPPGWSLAGENVAWGYGYTTVTSHWAASPGHYANLVGSFTDIGVGVGYSASGTPFYTQVFARY